MLSQKPYRSAQIINWLYKKLASSFDEMTDLSKDLREAFKKTFYISNLHLLQRQQSKDGTQKFLFELEDGETIESVLIPNSTGEDRFTLCISSQVGCAVGCKFCATGRLGLKRNLKAFEITDQVIAVKRFIAQGERTESQVPIQSGTGSETPVISNIVFMGMGEPLNNFNEVREALLRLTALMGYSKRRITVSTSGIIPGIRKLAESGPLVNIAVSLNAATDEIRSGIMPVNKQYPLKDLIKACREFPLRPNRRITFEYVMLSGINDSEGDARRLVKLLSGIKSKINLIPYNSSSKSIPFKPPADSDVLKFQEILKKAGLTSIIRKSMGGDISAACGQLKAAYGQ